MNRVDRFLCELAVVERVQPEPLCQRLEFLDGVVRLHLSGGHFELPLGADRRTIAQALRPVAKVVDPCQYRVPVEARHDRHGLWAQLLEDLGVYYPDMASISRTIASDRGSLTYQRIERVGHQGLVTVADGHVQLTFPVDLDAGRLPDALPVEIAYRLAPPTGPRTAQGASGSWTGQLGAWARRLRKHR